MTPASKFNIQPNGGSFDVSPKSDHASPSVETLEPLRNGCICRSCRRALDLHSDLALRVTCSFSLTLTSRPDGVSAPAHVKHRVGTRLEMANVDKRTPVRRSSVCLNTHTHTHTRSHTHVHTPARTHAHARTHTRSHTHAHSPARTHTHTCTRIHTCTHAYTHVRTHIHMYTHSQPRTHTHAHTRTRTLTYTVSCGPSAGEILLDETLAGGWGVGDSSGPQIQHQNSELCRTVRCKSLVGGCTPPLRTKPQSPSKCMV